MESEIVVLTSSFAFMSSDLALSSLAMGKLSAAASCSSSAASANASFLFGSVLEIRFKLLELNRTMSS